MEKHFIEETGSLVSQEERLRIIRLCASITGNVDVAEDLAQETLLEAWRHLSALREPGKRIQWLSGIARNVCLRWQRRHGRENSRSVVPSSLDQEMPFTLLEDTLVDDFDIEVELEHKELVELLDRALAQLPSEIRTLLIQRYVDQSPLAEVAERLGTNTSTAAMRLQRGKLALKRILTTSVSQEIAPYVFQTTSDEWEETPLWCHLCGQKHLQGKRNPDEGMLYLRCPACSPDGLVSQNHVSILKGVKGYKPAYSRLMAWCNTYYEMGLINKVIPCEQCGRSIQTQILLPEDLPAWLRNQNDMLAWLLYKHDKYDRIISIICPACRSSCQITLEGFALMLPEGRQFKQAHPRIRTLPKRQVEINGRLALVSRFESINDNAAFDVVSDYETYQTLQVYGDGR